MILARIYNGFLPELCETKKKPFAMLPGTNGNINILLHLRKLHINKSYT